MRTVIRWCRVQWDRALAILLTGVGAIALIVGWAGVSDAIVPAQQLPYIISGGIGGLFVLGVAAALWISADLHDEWRKLDRLEDLLRNDPVTVVDDARPTEHASRPQGNGASSRPARPLRTSSTRR
jgi:hypothetical protein